MGEKNEQSSDGSACRAGIALHVGLKTSARNIATAKALICNLLSAADAALGFLPRYFSTATRRRNRRGGAEDNAKGKSRVAVRVARRHIIGKVHLYDRKKRPDVRETLSRAFT